MIGLSGDTDAVLWNEELRMLTSIGEAEVTAFLSTIDPVEVKDIMLIHIVSAIPEETEVSEETGEGENVVTEDGEAAADAAVESEEPAEGADNSEVTEAVEGDGNIETVEAVEGEETAGAEDVSEDAVNAETVEEPESQEAEEPAAEAEEPETAEPVEISIRDLGENDVLSGEANGVFVIERERFELDDETLSGLVFEIEDESVAKLTEQSVEEMLVNGIGIRLLAEGETKLVIRQEGKEEPLCEIRLVVTAAQIVPKKSAEEVAEPETLTEPETVPEPEVVSEPAPEPVEEQAAAESGEETIEEFFPEPEAEEPVEEQVFEVIFEEPDIETELSGPEAVEAEDPVEASEPVIEE